jgi:hypothetical protein
MTLETLRRTNYSIDSAVCNLHKNCKNKKWVGCFFQMSIISVCFVMKAEMTSTSKIQYLQSLQVFRNYQSGCGFRKLKLLSWQVVFRNYQSGCGFWKLKLLGWQVVSNYQSGCRFWKLKFPNSQVVFRNYQSGSRFWKLKLPDLQVVFRNYQSHHRFWKLKLLGWQVVFRNYQFRLWVLSTSSAIGVQGIMSCNLFITKVRWQLAHGVWENTLISILLRRLPFLQIC